MSMRLNPRDSMWIKLALAVWMLLCAAILVRACVQPQRNSVYPIFYYGGLQWRDAAGLYGFVGKPIDMDQFRYAPIVAGFFGGLSYLPETLGGLVWRLASASCFFFGLAWFLHHFVKPHGSLTLRHWAWMGLALIPITLPSFNNAQANTLVIGLLMMAVVACRQERWNLAACCLTISICFKIYPLALALLLLLVYPWRLGPRLALGLLLGYLAPFLLQSSAYVNQEYRTWVELLMLDDRHDYPLNRTYQDFHILVRCLGYALPAKSYMGLQLAVAGCIALTVLIGQYQGWKRERLLLTILHLGCCWMLLFGPATESCTYILLVPTLALTILEACQSKSRMFQGLMMAFFLILTARLAGNSITIGRNWAFVFQPLITLILFGIRWWSAFLPEPTQESKRKVSATRVIYDPAAFQSPKEVAPTQKDLAL